jgi:hypothetical protein
MEKNQKIKADFLSLKNLSLGCPAIQIPLRGTLRVADCLLKAFLKTLRLIFFYAIKKRPTFRTSGSPQSII